MIEVDFFYTQKFFDELRYARESERDGNVNLFRFDKMNGRFYLIKFELNFSQLLGLDTEI